MHSYLVGFCITIVLCSSWTQQALASRLESPAKRETTDYTCKPSSLPFTSNLTRIENPAAVNNYYLSTNGESSSIMIRIYPLPLNPHPQQITVYVSHEFCPTDSQNAEYMVETVSLSYATIFINDADFGDYLTYVQTDGPYAIQACASNCSTLCKYDCSGNGYCDVRSNECVCAPRWGGTYCQLFCQETGDDCEPAPPHQGGGFPFFGSMTITILLIGVLPCLVVTGVTTALVSYCSKTKVHKKKEHTQPILVYQSLPYQKPPN